jgi:hypothetical protein
MLHSNAGEAGDPPLSSLVVDDADDVSDSMRRLLRLFFVGPSDVNLLSCSSLALFSLSLLLGCGNKDKIIFFFIFC